MTDAITVRFDDTEVIARLQQIARKFDNMAPAMRAIGEILSESTKERFATSTAPDGSQWKPNAPATILAMLAKISGNYAAYTNLKTRKEGRVRVGDKKGYFDKTGKVTQKTAQRLAAKKPLVDTGILADTIRYQVGSDGNSVAIGTNRFAGEWSGGAAVHQFGSKDGHIRARPFLGISAGDRSEVLAILDRFLAQAVSG
jgi:phage gpG-like protein